MNGMNVVGDLSEVENVLASSSEIGSVMKAVAIYCFVSPQPRRGS